METQSMWGMCTAIWLIFAGHEWVTESFVISNLKQVSESLLLFMGHSVFYIVAVSDRQNA